MSYFPGTYLEECAKDFSRQCTSEDLKKIQNLNLLVINYLVKIFKDRNQDTTARKDLEADPSNTIAHVVDTLHVFDYGLTVVEKDELLRLVMPLALALDEAEKSI